LIAIITFFENVPRKGIAGDRLESIPRCSCVR
jgi:hypothetical protein